MGHDKETHLTSEALDWRVTEAAPLQPIERVLNYGSFASTYKLALLRAIADWLVAHPHGHDNDLEIPLSWVATRFLDYYWPLTVPNVVPQADRESGRTRVQTEIIRHAERLSSKRHGLPALDAKLGGVAYWWALRNQLATPEHGLAAGLRLVLAVRRIVIEQPLTYVRNVDGRSLDFFDVVGAETDSKGRYKEPGKLLSELSLEESLAELDARDPVRIRVPTPLYGRLAPLRFCIREATVGKWAAMTPRFAPTWTGSDVLQLLQDPDPERDSVLMRRYREIYESHGLALNCLLSEKRLRRDWDLDHLAPWSRFPVNRFWNLVPLAPPVNRAKSNRLVALTAEQRKRFSGHLNGCLDTNEPLIKADVLATVGEASAAVDGGWFLRHAEGVMRNLVELTGLPALRVPVHAI